MRRETRLGLSSAEENKDQTKKNNYFCIIIEKFFSFCFRRNTRNLENFDFSSLIRVRKFKSAAVSPVSRASGDIEKR